MSDLGVGSWPWRRARMLPAAVAFRQGDRSYTYRELADRVDALGAAFAGMGIGPGDRVAYLGPNDIATFETFFAAARIGAIFVPLNTRLAGPEIAALLEDSSPAVLVHGPESADLVAAAAPACPLVPTGAFDELIRRGGDRPAAEVALADDAVILYTSGTTGRSKGAVLTHANLTFNVMNQLAHIDVLSTDVALCTAPLFHVTGLGQVSLPTLFKGGTVVVAPRFDPAWLLRTIGELRINCFSGVPTMLQQVCEHPDWAGADVSSLRYVNYGGSPVPERVAVAWQDRGVTLLQGYGMTEASPGVLMALPEGSADRPGSAGVAQFFTDVALRAPGGVPQVGPGTGELLARGPNVFRGYWERPDDTDGAFVDGWFRSGDVVRIGGDGWSYVVDRVKDMIISGGENIYPAEVEAVINEVPGVADSALVGVPDAKWGEVGLAYVVRRAGAGLDEDGLRAHLDGRLGRYKIPKYVTFVDELPRTATGKIRKAELRATAAAETSRETP